MTAIEFQAELNAEQALPVPPEAARGIPRGQPVRVIVLVADSDADWERLAADEFGQGYADSDAIYDRFSTR